jgi:5-methylcytosine-specific restriction endonuclease McrA
MNTAVAKRTRGRVTAQVNVEALAGLILTASACAYCGGPLDTFGYAVDHIIPLARNGPHTLENLAVACQPCNRAKGDLLEPEFRSVLTGIVTRSS